MAAQDVTQKLHVYYNFVSSQTFRCRILSATGHCRALHESGVAKHDATKQNWMTGAGSATSAKPRKSGSEIPMTCSFRQRSVSGALRKKRKK